MCARKIVAIVIAVLAVDAASTCSGQSLKDDLRWIDKLRNGRRTPLDEVDRRGEELLNKYSAPNEQGRIYYQLAHMHAQSGVLRPEQVIAYATKALQCPLELSQRMRLHTYWGDALLIPKEKKPFATKRREAAPVYLKGLRNLIALKLPEKPPETELMGFFNGPNAEENRRKGEEQSARRQQIDFQREMINHRQVLQGQIVSLYGRRPVATEELKDMATNILGEGKDLDRLMTAVNDKVAKLPPEANNSVPPVEAEIPTPPSKYWYLLATIAAGAVLAAVLVLLSRWRRANRQAGSKAVQ